MSGGCWASAAGSGAGFGGGAVAGFATARGGTLDTMSQRRTGLTGSRWVSHGLFMSGKGLLYGCFRVALGGISWSDIVAMSI